MFQNPSRLTAHMISRGSGRRTHRFSVSVRARHVRPVKGVSTEGGAHAATAPARAGLVVVHRVQVGVVGAADSRVVDKHTPARTRLMARNDQAEKQSVFGVLP